MHQGETCDRSGTRKHIAFPYDVYASDDECSAAIDTSYRAELPISSMPGLRNAQIDDAELAHTITPHLCTHPGRTLILIYPPPPSTSLGVW